MTVTSIYQGGTTTPLAHVRTVQVKSKPVGWLECTANEFLRLLAEHEAGKINLLEMPECANDADDDVADDTDDEPIARHCGRSLNAVRGALRRNRTMFVIAGDAVEDGRKKTWTKVDR